MCFRNIENFIAHVQVAKRAQGLQRLCKLVVSNKHMKHMKQLAVTRVTPRVLSKKVSKHLFISGGLKILADNKGTEGR